MRYFQLFRITGVANVITYDGGLKSTAAEPKRLLAVHIQMDKHAGTDDNDVQGYHEQAKVFDIPEKLFPCCLTASVAPDKAEPTSKPVPVDIDLPVGDIFKVAIKCAATLCNMRGTYEFEIVT